jgi:hypothetical protein
MATESLFDVLGAPQLCGMIQGTVTGVPNVFPGDPIAKTGFYCLDKSVERDSGTYTRVTGTRTTAKLAAYGAPSSTRNLRNVESVPVVLMHTVESVSLPMFNFRGLIKKDADASNLQIDDQGIQEITRQVKEFRKNFDNLRVASLTQLFAAGQIFFDGQGNLLPNSTGAVTIASAQVPAGNQGQLNVLGAGNVIDTPWSNPAADIDRQMQSLRQAAVRLTGYPLKYAFYGKNVPKYMTDNSKIASYFIRNPAADATFIGTADIPNPLFGLTWLPAYESFFEDQNGELQGLFGDDQVVFTPEPDRDWMGWLEGKYDIPASIGMVESDAVGQLANTQVVSGMFAYAVVTADPLTIKMVAGDTFLPVIKVPTAVFQATVNF